MSHSDLLQEIEADIQRQKFNALWQRYGIYGIALVLVLVLGTAAYSSWRTHQLNDRQEATSALMRLSDDKSTDFVKHAAAFDAFAAAHSETAAATLSSLQAAGVELKDGKTEAAVAHYDAVAADNHADPLLRQLATVLSVQTQLDKGDPVTLQARLQPLMTGSAWRFSAREFAAHLALRAGDKAKARQLFDELNHHDPDMPPSIAQRAKYMADWLSEGK